MVKKFLKSVNRDQIHRKNKSGTVSLVHGVRLNVIRTEYAKF